MNPIEAINDWFVKLPVDHRQDIAFFVLSLLPGHSRNGRLGAEDLVKEFLSWLQIDIDSKLHTTGKALIIRAFVNHTLHRKRATNEDWNETEELFDFFKQKAEEEGKEPIIEEIEHNQQRIPLRKKQWQKTLRAWEILCKGPLSDVSLEEWRK